MKPLFLFAISLTVSGCAATNRLRTDLSARQTVTRSEEAALIGNLRDAYSGCSAGEAVKCRMNTRLSSAQLTDFVGAGTALSDYYCDIFFRATNQAARQRRFSRNLTNDVGGAVATVLGLAKAGSGVVGGVAAGFSLADGSFRNYDESFMVDADLAKLRRLVLAAQDNMKLQVAASPPTTVFAAESTILRYAGLCSFLGMQDLLNDSVAKKTADIETENSALQPQRVGPLGAAPGVVPPAAATSPPVAQPAPPSGG